MLVKNPLQWLFFSVLISIALFLCSFTNSCHAEPNQTEIKPQYDRSLDAQTLAGHFDLWHLPMAEAGELSFAANSLSNDGKNYKIVPEISWSFEGKSTTSQRYRPTSKRNYRYQSTIPVVYRITLKGYSIVEFSDHKTEAWTLDRIHDLAIQKPEIMISFSKRF